MNSRKNKTGQLLTTSSDTNIDKSLFTRDYRNVVLHLSFSGTAVMTMSIRGAIGDTAPDFNAAPSATNRWETINVIDLQTGSAVAGDTGIAVVADDERLVEININHLDWVCPLITAYTSGVGNVYYSMVDNQ